MKKYLILNCKVYLILFLLFTVLSGNLFGQEDGFDKPPHFNEGKEFDPCFNNRGDVFVFISNKSGNFKIYQCSKIDGIWSEPQEIESINNYKEAASNVRHPGFNHDGTIMFFDADFNKDSSGIDIFYVKKNGDGWSEPVSIGAPVNSKEYDGQPSISIDNKTLYFSRNRENEEYKDVDCKSIFVTTLNDENKWNVPEMLPIPINVGCEQCPKIGVDNKTLYFSSIREEGKGGFDLFKTKLIAKGVWVPAIPLDSLNSEYDEYSAAMYFNSEKNLFQREVKDKRSSISRLVTGTVYPQYKPDRVVMFKGNINDLTKKTPLDAKIDVYNPVTSRSIASYVNNSRSGDYEIYLLGQNKYQIDFHKNGYSHEFLIVDAENLRENKIEQKNISLYNNIKLLLNTFDDEIFRPVDTKIEIINSQNVPVDIPMVKEKSGRYLLDIPLGESYEFTLTAPYYDTLNFSFDLTGIVQFGEFEKDAELKAKKVEFQIEVSDEATDDGLPVEVVITNLDKNEVIRTTATKGEDGKYTIKLRDGDRYSVNVSPKGYSFYSTTVDLKKKNTSRKLKVKLKELKEDTKLTLNNITFEVNSADLNESSFLELNRVVKLMKDNPDINIEIAAHTDNVGSDAYNLKLSNRRAASVQKYLLEESVPKTRLIAKGYGEAKPLYPNDTDEHKALNRRVELKIIKIQ